MKNRPVSRLANCWLSVMLPRAATIAPLTACTIPGPSVQLSVTTQWNRCGLCGSASVVIRTAYRDASGRRAAAVPGGHPADTG